MTWQCYWVEDTGEAALGLRRFTWGDAANSCPGSTLDSHSALRWLDRRVPRGRVADEDGWEHYEHADDSFGDIEVSAEMWPTTCEKCDYEFTAEDQYQRWAEEIMVCPATGEEFTDHPFDAPPGVAVLRPGAMRDAWWLARLGEDGRLGLNPDRPKDGITLQVLCPYMDDRPYGQQWCVDQRASGETAGFWTRTGDPRDPPSLTVQPSIAIGVSGQPGFYHSFLTNGVLGDHLGG